MKKILILAGLTFVILLIGFAQAVTITEGDGISFNVQGLQDGSLVQLTCDGYLVSNGDGTYRAECPGFVMPIFLHNSVVYVAVYDGTPNQFIIVKDGVTVSYVFVKDVRSYLEINPGTYDFTLQGQTSKNLVHTKFTITGTKTSGPEDFTISANQIDASGYATLKITINGIQKFKKTYEFGNWGKKTITIAPTPTITIKPTPTPQPTKSSAQIWAERNCWWYRA